MKKFINKSLEKCINHYLALDPESESRLAALNGKIITLELLAVNWILHLRIIDKKIIIEEAITETPDVVIKGTPLSLLHMSIAKDNRKQFFSDDVSIEGNLELGQQIIDLFDQMEIDWEEYLSKVTGDVPANQFGRVVRTLKTFSQRFRESFLQNVNEYVHEEKCVFPPREAVEDFFHDIDQLRMDADRLAARIARLQLNTSKNQ
jgi:ubiquinone biosynthesis protein UbiJ